MKYLSKMSANIPPKARGVLVILAVLVIFFIFIFINLFSSSNDSVDQKLPGRGDVIKAPGSRDIKKTEPGDEIIIPKDSPISQQIEKDRQAAAEAAKENGGGFMDRLDFANSRDVLDQSNQTGKKVNIAGLQSVEDADSQNQIEAERKRLAAQQRDRLQGQYDENARREGQSRQRDELMGTDAYLSQVLAEFEKNDPYTGYWKTKGDRHDAVSSGYNEYARNLNSVKASDKTATASSATSRSQHAPSGSALVDSYLSGVRTSDQLPVADPSKLDAYRGKTNAAPGSESKNNIAEKMSYANVVNPLSNGISDPKLTVNVGEMYYGILQIGVNTDEIGPIRAILPGFGKLQGAVLVGEPVRVGEVASINFRDMTVNGKSTGIVAVALDPDTLRPGIADGVDRHIFERYFKLSLAAAAEGYVKALTGTTTTTYPNGNMVSIQDRLPKASDQLASAVGRVGEVLIPKFERDFDRPPTVTVNSNRDVIIMFLNQVEM